MIEDKKSKHRNKSNRMSDSEENVDDREPLKFGKFVENIKGNYVQIKNCWIGFVVKTLCEWYLICQCCY